MCSAERKEDATCCREKLDEADANRGSACFVLALSGKGRGSRRGSEREKRLRRG